MKVSIDIQSVVGNRSGVGQYTYQLVRALSDPGLADAEDVGLLLSYFDFQGRFPGAGLASPRVRLRRIRAVPGRLMQAWWRRFRQPSFDLFSGPADVFHFPNFVLRPVRRGRCVITVHDVGFLRFPRTVEPRNLQFLTRYLPDSIRRADRVITVSEFCRSEILHFFDLPPERVAVTPLGVTPNYFRLPSIERMERLRFTYKLPPRFILSVATLEPRKNHVTLLRAFARLLSLTRDPTLQCVLAGGNGWLYDDIYREVRALKIGDRVRFLGYVPDRDLPGLYRAAALFAFPSLYEGFGLPPLEAMASGTPVVVAAAGSLPEVCGDAALRADPGDPDALASRMADILSKPALRETLVERGRERARAFDWRRTAKLTLRVYREAAAS